MFLWYFFGFQGLCAACTITIRSAPLEEECGSICPLILKFIIAFTPICMCWGSATIFQAATGKSFRLFGVQNLRCDVPMTSINHQQNYQSHHRIQPAVSRHDAEKMDKVV